MTNCELSRARVQQNGLEGADFTGANMPGAEFRESDLTGVKFHDCNLQGADFRKANIFDASFKNMQIENALYYGKSPWDGQAKAEDWKNKMTMFDGE